MTEETMALGRRAVACKGWRWMPGMVAIHPDLRASRVLFGSGYTFLGAFRRALKTKNPYWWQGWSGQVQHGQYGYAGFEHCTPVPDLSDPATLGCLLALVREAWGDHGFYVAQSNTRIKDTDVLGWDFFGSLHGKSCKGMLYRYEAEALVSALEAAP